MKINLLGKTVLASALFVIIIGVSLFFVKTKNENYYRTAINDLKDRLRSPESLIVYDAWYDDEKIIIEYNAKNGYGGYGDRGIALYYFAGEFAGESEGNLFLHKRAGIGSELFSYLLSSAISYPIWLINDGMNPLKYVGIALILVSIGAGLFVRFGEKYFHE